MARAVVIGLGNVALADDGLGVHAVRLLDERGGCGPYVELVEGGTAGLLLLPLLADCEGAVLLDAIDLGATPGTLHALDGREWITAFQARMSVHDTGLTDLLGAALLADALPPRLAVLGLQPAYLGWGERPSPQVQMRLGRLACAVSSRLAAWGFGAPAAWRGLAARPVVTPTAAEGPAGGRPAVGQATDRRTRERRAGTY